MTPQQTMLRNEIVIVFEALSIRSIVVQFDPVQKRRGHFAQLISFNAYLMSSGSLFVVLILMSQDCLHFLF